MKPFRLTVLASHACIRVDKLSIPIIERGYDVHLIANRPPHWVGYYSTFSQYKDMGQLTRLIDVFDPVTDIYHVHNEPSWFVTAIKERSNKPVIIDIHDSFLARSTPEENAELMKNGNGKNYVRVVTEERNNFQLADGLVFPGETFKNIIMDEFKLKQPYLVMPSYLPHRMQGYNAKEWLGGLVYEGRMDLKSENKDPVHYGFRYTDYEELALKCKELKLDFHIYSRADKPFLDIYEKIAFTHVPQDYDNLISCLTRHDWGLVGNSFPCSEWDVAFPNKLFEYIAACVPVVAFNAEECAKFVEENEIGIRINSLEELTSRWKEHEKFRTNLIKKRREFFMENHTPKLIEFYEGFL